MKMLHLFSNWKWTGPAEPALNLAAALMSRGHEVEWLGGRAPKGCTNYLEEQAQARRVPLRTGFRLRKHRHPVDNALDVRALRRRLEENPVDLIHAHLDNDHLIAARALAKLPAGIPLIRTSYAGDPTGLRYLPRLLSATDRLLCVSHRVEAWVGERSPGGKPRVEQVDGAVDIERFSPGENFERRGGKLVVGVVARMQTHRRFEVLLEAFRRVAERREDVEFRVIGRGTNQEKVAVEPVRAMGLEDRVKFLGYLPGDRYVSALRELSLLVYLVPGSDGSCRTVQEALACGLPVVRSQRGILPELVGDEVEGLGVEEDPESLAAALLRLAADRDLLRSLSSRAVSSARDRFDLCKQAVRVERIYEATIREKTDCRSGR